MEYFYRYYFDEQGCLHEEKLNCLKTKRTDIKQRIETGYIDNYHINGMEVRYRGHDIIVKDFVSMSRKGIAYYYSLTQDKETAIRCIIEYYRQRIVAFNEEKKKIEAKVAELSETYDMLEELYEH